MIPWVRFCGLDRHLDGFDQKDIRRASRPPEDDELEADLVRRVAEKAVHML